MFPADYESFKRSNHKEQVNRDTRTTHNASETEHFDQPAERDEEVEAADQMKEKQQLHYMDQSKDADSKSREGDAVQLDLQEKENLDQEESDEGEKTPMDSAESDSDTEQVETFFSTMSHRYENDTQENPIF